MASTQDTTGLEPAEASARNSTSCRQKWLANSDQRMKTFACVVLLVFGAAYVADRAIDLQDTVLGFAAGMLLVVGVTVALREGLRT